MVTIDGGDYASPAMRPICRAAWSTGAWCAADFPASLLTWTECNQDLRRLPQFHSLQDDWPVPQRALLRRFAADIHCNKSAVARDIAAASDIDAAADHRVGRLDRTTFEPARIQYNAPLLTAAPIQPPFNQDDWPVPSAQRQPDRTFQRAFPPTLVGQDRLPVRQQYWPVPIAPDYSVSLRSFLASPGLPLITAPVQPPFSQDDWPLPIAAIQPIRTWTQSPTIATPVVAPTFMPGRVSEWGMWERVPFTPARSANTSTAVLPEEIAVEYVFREPYYCSAVAEAGVSKPGRPPVNLALLTSPPPQKPFNQTDWPLTPAHASPIAPSSEHSRRNCRTRPIPDPSEDWPLPVPVAPVNDLRTFIGQSQKQPVVLPFRQSDWPVPIATEFSNALRSIGFRSPALDVVAPRPFVQSDWPLPCCQSADRTFQRPSRRSS